LILATSHGRRTIDTIKQWKPELANIDCKHSPPQKLKGGEIAANFHIIDVREVEGRIPKEHAADAKELPGK